MVDLNFNFRGNQHTDTTLDMRKRAVDRWGMNFLISRLQFCVLNFRELGEEEANYMR